MRRLTANHGIAFVTPGDCLSDGVQDTTLSHEKPLLYVHYETARGSIVHHRQGPKVGEEKLATVFCVADYWQGEGLRK